MKTRFTILLTFFAYSIFAQTKISGIVRDEKGEAIPGANVFIQDSYDGISSDFEGKFSFIAEEKGKKLLVATFVGYKQFQQAVELRGQALTIQIILK